VQHKYPNFVTGIVERMFRVENPDPKPGVRRILREERKKAGISLMDLIRDALTGLKGFG
jgi:electron transfer flavoprotein-quinone oxidoreductase